MGPHRVSFTMLLYFISNLYHNIITLHNYFVIIELSLNERLNPLIFS